MPFVTSPGPEQQGECSVAVKGHPMMGKRKALDFARTRSKRFSAPWDREKQFQLRYLAKRKLRNSTQRAATFRVVCKVLVLLVHRTLYLRSWSLCLSR